jgi:hypothetical protein
MRWTVWRQETRISQITTVHPNSVDLCHQYHSFYQPKVIYRFLFQGKISGNRATCGQNRGRFWSRCKVPCHSQCPVYQVKHLGLTHIYIYIYIYIYTYNFKCHSAIWPDTENDKLDGHTSKGYIWNLVEVGVLNHSFLIKDERKIPTQTQLLYFS